MRFRRALTVSQYIVGDVVENAKLEARVVFSLA